MKEQQEIIVEIESAIVTPDRNTVTVYSVDFSPLLTATVVIQGTKDISDIIHTAMSKMVNLIKLKQK